MASASGKIQQPLFYHRHYENDIKHEIKDCVLIREGKRIALVAFPFFGLYKPFQFSLSVVSGGLRSFTTTSQFLSNVQRREYIAGSHAFLQMSLALISLVGTLFAHPLGMLITTIHDCSLDCFHTLHHLYAFEFFHASVSYIHLVNNSLYLALFLGGGLHIAVASLSVQVFIGLNNSLSEFRKGNRLEGGGHLLMGIIRSSQLYGQVQLLQMGWQMQVLSSNSKEEPAENPSSLPSSTTGNFFHDLALYLQKPVERASEYFLRAICTPPLPGKEGNFQSATLERISRSASIFFSVASAPITVTLYALGEGMHFCGDAINGTSYTYWKGNAEEKLDEGKLRCMTLNACMLWGGLPIPLGGVRPPRERIKQLADLIKEQDPDILFFQEMSFSASADLFDHLKDQYTHCFTRIGPNYFRMESGLCVFSKIPIQNPRFIPFPNQNGIKRGAFFLETPSRYFVTSHMEAGHNMENERRRQFDLITEEIETLKKKKDKDVFLLGDLNIDSFSSLEEYDRIIGKHKNYFDPLRDQHVGTESATNVLVNHMRGKQVYKNLSEIDDYALYSGDSKNIHFKTQFINTYSTDDPYQAISDHKALVVDITHA